MSLEILSRPTRRFLAERLDRLQETLETFGQRVREGIAAVIGTHIGDAVRDALHAVLYTRQEFRRDPFDHRRDDRVERYDGVQHERFDEEPDEFWHEPESHSRPTSTPAATAPSRWRGMLTGGLHLAGWCLQDRLARRGQTALGVAGVAGVAAVACLLGPVAAGLLALGGAAVWLSGLRRAAVPLARACTP